MNLKYIIADEAGNIGQTIPITQGDQRLVNVFFYNEDGSPFFFEGSDAVLRIMAGINTSPIEKTTTGVTPQDSLGKAEMSIGGAGQGICGLTFTLTEADTTAMAINSGGLPMTATLSNSDTDTNLQLDFPAVFMVTGALVPMQ